MSEPRFDATIRTAEQVVRILGEHQVPALVIGALALAAHGHARATEALDLAVSTPPGSLMAVAETLRAEGWDVELRMPDADDPLGGVIDVRAPGCDLVQIVNFDNSPGGGFPRLVHEALQSSVEVRGSTLRMADVQTLIKFKLYAGGTKSDLDVLALLEREDIDRSELRQWCAEVGLSPQLERVLAMESGRNG